jgi:DNA-binding NtrC family response regulator
MSTEHKKLVVLLVEDDDSIREISEMILEGNYEVHAVRNGDEAEAWLRHRKPNLLFTDVRMPGKVSGQELATRHRDLPVLVTSGEAKEQHAWVEAPMGYLAKPYDRKTLLAAVQSLAA